MTADTAATLTRGNDPVYWLGRDAAEADRLILQARLYNPSTRWLLERAGLRRGMRVLDVGSGSGDVAILARELVGADGAVVGLDQNPDVLDVARGRAHAAGFENVSFFARDIRALDVDEMFDAVVGRFVLKYIGDPVVAVANAVRHLVPGGIVAFQEMNLNADSLHVYPAVPLWDQAWSWVCQSALRAGVETVMGYRMWEVYAAAGLVDLRMHLTANVASGPDDELYDYFALTIRSMLPLILSTGVATSAEIELDTLAERLRAATLASRATVKYPNLVGAWGRVPATGALRAD